MSHRKIDDVAKETVGKLKTRQERPSPARPAEDPLEIFTLRIPASWKPRLDAHFKSMGLATGAGIRMLIAKYMEQERV